MMRENREIVLKDIYDQYQLNEKQIQSFQYIEKDGYVLFYIPYMLRSENEVYLQSLDFILNQEGRVLNSGLCYWGEGEPASKREDTIYETSKDDEKHLNFIINLLENRNQFFKENIYQKDIKSIFDKFTIEIIQQDANYRLRIRSLFSQVIVLDFYYEQATDSLKINEFNPI